LETPFYKDNINTWSFFEDSNTTCELFEKTIVRKVEKEIGILLPTIVLLLSLWENYTKNNFYQAELSDKNVNEIKRSEGQELQFFSMKEVEKLSMSPSSQKFLGLCKTIIEASFTPSLQTA